MLITTQLLSPTAGRASSPASSAALPAAGPTASASPPSEVQTARSFQPGAGRALSELPFLEVEMLDEIAQRAAEQGQELQTQVKDALADLTEADMAALKSLGEFFPDNPAAFMDTVIFVLAQTEKLSLEQLNTVAQQQLLCDAETPEEDRLATLQVYAIVHDAIQRGVSRADDLGQVLDVIAAGNRLRIDFSQSLPRGMIAGFNAEDDILKLSKLDIRRLFMRSLLLHESIHAADELSPREASLPEDQDGTFFAYESEINAYLAAAEYRQAYGFELDPPDRFARNTLQERADDYVRLRAEGAAPSELTQKLKELKDEVLRIYQRNYRRAYGEDFDYASYQKPGDGIPVRELACDESSSKSVL